MKFLSLFLTTIFSLTSFSKGLIVAECEGLDIKVNNQQVSYVTVVAGFYTLQNELTGPGKGLGLDEVAIIFHKSNGDSIASYYGEKKLIGVMNQTKAELIDNGVLVKEEGSRGVVLKSTAETIKINIPQLGVNTGSKPVYAYCKY